MAGSRMDIGFQVFRKTLELGLMSGWPIQRSDSGGCGTLGRTAGWIAHVMEQRLAGFVLRPRAKYVSAG